MANRKLEELNSLIPQFSDFIPIARAGGALSKITLSVLQALISNATFGAKSIREYLTDVSGVTDQRAQLITAINAAKNNAFKLIIDCPVFIDVGTDHTKVIFLPDNLNIEFLSNGKFIVNNKGVPTFAIIHTSNITFRDAKFSWLNTIDSVFVNYSGGQPFAGQFSDGSLKTWLTANKGVTFSNSNPMWAGPGDGCSTINIRGNSRNLNFLGETTFTSENLTNAYNMMISGISFNPEVKANQIFLSQANVTPTFYDIPSDIYFEKLILDGVSMGLVGVMSGIKIEKLISNRYTDVQDNTGKIAQWYSPPHAIYESRGDGYGFAYKDNFINEYIDYGVYVGAARRRGAGGYAHSFKIATFRIGRMICLRPDGVGDILASGLPVAIDDLYAEYDSSLFTAEFTASTSGNVMTVTSIARGFIEADSRLNDNLDRSQYANGQFKILPFGTNGTTGTGGVGTYALNNTPTNTASTTFITSFGFPALRFLGGASTYNGVVVKKAILKDNAAYSLFLPIGSSGILANKNCFFDLKVFLKDFKGYDFPSFYLSGEGHQINMDVLLQSHTQLQKYVGVTVGAGAAPTGLKDVLYNCTVSGWRNVLADVAGLRNRVLFNGNDVDSYGNVLKLTDISNKHEVISYDGLLEEIITLTQIITPAAGGAFTSSFNIPGAIDSVNWTPIKAGARVMTAITGPTSVQVGISGTPTFLGTLSGLTTTGKFTNDSAMVSASGNRAIVLTPVGGNFSGTGSIRLSITLKRTDMPV